MQHKRLSRFTSMLAIFLFAMAALSFFKNSQFLFGFILLIISFLNIITLTFLKDRKKKFDVILNGLNAVAAGITAYDYVQKGTNYIQYVWMFTALIFLALAIFLLAKKESLKRHQR